MKQNDSEEYAGPGYGYKVVATPTATQATGMKTYTVTTHGVLSSS